MVKILRLLLHMIRTTHRDFNLVPEFLTGIHHPRPDRTKQPLPAGSRNRRNVPFFRINRQTTKTLSRIDDQIDILFLAELPKSLQIRSEPAGELHVRDCNNPSPIGDRGFQLFKRPRPSERIRHIGDTVFIGLLERNIAKQHQLDASPFLLHDPRIVIGRVLVDVADHLIAGLERIAVGDHGNRLGRVGRHRDIVGLGFHQRGEVFLKSTGDMILARIFEDHPQPHLRLHLQALDGTIRCRPIQR